METKSPSAAALDAINRRTRPVGPRTPDPERRVQGDRQAIGCDFRTSRRRTGACFASGVGYVRIEYRVFEFVQPVAVAQIAGAHHRRRLRRATSEADTTTASRRHRRSPPATIRQRRPRSLQFSSELMSFLLSLQQISASSSTSEASSETSSAQDISAVASATGGSPLDRLFSAIDADSSGDISEDEFSSFVSSLGGSSEEASQIYAALDADGDGAVSKDDLAAALPPPPAAGRRRPSRRLPRAWFRLSTRMATARSPRRSWKRWHRAPAAPRRRPKPFWSCSIPTRAAR